MTELENSEVWSGPPKPAVAFHTGIWDRTKVARVDICCFETISTLGRGGYFDAYGIIRDVLQNHLAQILALVAMEQPLSFGAADVRAGQG